MRSRTSNGLRGPGLARTSMTCVGSTASVYAGTTRGAIRSARVELARILVTGETAVHKYSSNSTRLEAGTRSGGSGSKAGEGMAGALGGVGLGQRNHHDRFL